MRRSKGGALLLDGSGHVATDPLPVSLQAKTLEATVQLHTLDQRGGGIVTVQDLKGNVFDSIVFGEKNPRHWLAGSNHFARTNALEGETETEAHDSPVHIAIVYDEDGTIRAYRNGVPYGAPYRKSSLVSFEANQSQILFGLRHGSPSGNRLLKGRILDAKVYGRALSEPEILAASGSGNLYITHNAILVELTSAQTAGLELLEKQIKDLRREQETLGKPVTQNQVWTDLGHALFNLKEFIYLK